ncbi:MAG: NifB/NifX family molybdenum-iron cluster-binding protein [Parasulfuritortus sp.]|jgi:nitrogen fixation protein NifX|nr:NifB/NifX family molybdenum-iron cluster-binding protein [Parasulfuritortus sp.]
MRHLKLVHSTEAAPVMSVKIAFASSDRKQVDQHFGAAEAFVIYELGQDDARLVEAVEFHDSDTAMDGHEGKLAAKIELLAGCAAVYCNAVGASAIKQLLAAGIQPMKVPEGMAVDELLCGLNQSLSDNPPAWLAKNMKSKDATRFDEMADEGWSE